MFEEYYAPLPSKKQYLERIGLSGAFKPDKETLDRLIQAHQTSVPFENLDVYDAAREIRLDTQGLFDKLVARRRGGYCFELTRCS
jgi:N-hydroxyarylamine O-acetyltransferase